MPSRRCRLFQLDLHFFAQLQIERAQRLIEQQHLGLIDERTRQRDALTLAAGKLRRAAFALHAELHEVEHLARALRARRRVDAAYARTVGDVLQHGHVREQRVVLEHGVDVAVVGRHGRHVLAVEQHLPAIGRVEARHQPQARGLARARGPEHREELAGLDGERHVVDRAHVAEDARDAAELDRRRHATTGALFAADDRDVVGRPAVVGHAAFDVRSALGFRRAPERDLVEVLDAVGLATLGT